MSDNDRCWYWIMRRNTAPPLFWFWTFWVLGLGLLAGLTFGVILGVWLE
jgi:hypothetical protein